jgi:formylglycine-generating enzyme required for sulfatase activity
MAVHQVRNRDFARFLDAAGRAAPPQWTDPALNHPDQPVVSVSWFDAVAYCRWLSEVCGCAYRLPTEAEWERAALGGRESSLWVWGDEPPQSRPEYLRRWSGPMSGPRPVAEETPNPYGVFDLGENVHEWCADFYSKDYYAHSPERNPRGPESGERRASRGGSWRHHIKVTRCAARSSIPPDFHYADYGFRVVCAGPLLEL